ncbi:MAG: hypothetical protein ABSG46_20105 [Candidatus Binataceae bacterium]
MDQVKHWRLAVLGAAVLVPLSAAVPAQAAFHPAAAHASALAARPAVANAVANVGFSEPRIFVVSRPVPDKDLLVYSMKVEVSTRPLDFHTTIEMFKWPAVGSPYKYQHTGVFNITDLPAAGSSRIWQLRNTCSTGRFFIELTISGTSSSGKYQHEVEFYPEGTKSGKTDAAIRPTRKQSHLIKAC